MTDQTKTTDRPPTLDRRKFLKLSTLGYCASFLPSALPTALSARVLAENLPKPLTQPLYFSAATNSSGAHFFMCLNRLGEIICKIPVDQRGHDALRSPDGRTALMISRRPGTILSAFDLVENRLKTQIHSDEGRHFYGHMMFSPDGKYLYVPENDYANKRGLISVRDTSTFEVVDEFSSGGVGPHQIGWLADNRTIVVANGGIHTRPDKHRVKLNIATMRPNLAYINSDNGEILDIQELDNHQLSVRHFDVTDKDEVLVGLQYQGDETDSVPLLALHRPGENIMPLTNISDAELKSLNHYVASVAVDSESRIGVGTCPRGSKITFWNLDSGEFITSRRFRDVAGVTFDAERSEFVVSNGRGEIYRYNTTDFSWNSEKSLRIAGLKLDNHLTMS